MRRESHVRFGEGAAARLVLGRNPRPGRTDPPACDAARRRQVPAARVSCVILPSMTPAEIHQMQTSITETINRIARGFLTPYETSCPEVPLAERLERVAQQDRVVAVLEGAELLDPVDVDDRRAVDAQEPRRVEASGEPGRRLVVRVFGRPRMQHHVVAGGLDPIDVVHAHEESPPFVLDEQPLGIAPDFG